MADRRPADDPSIDGDELLYFRVFPAEDALNPIPGEDGQFRPGSGYVRGRDPNGPASVDRSSLSTPQETRDRGTNGNFHVAAVRVSAVRALGLRVVADPLPDAIPPNLAHAHLIGTRKNPPEAPNAGDMTGGLTGSDCRKIAGVTRIVLLAAAREPQENGGA